MTEQVNSAVAASVAELMVRYGFDLDGYSLDRLLELWLTQYPPTWLYNAVIEALYQGRYKAISVWQILDLWRRRGRPMQHFNRDFERIISGRSIPLLFSESLAASALTPEPVLIAAEVGDRAITLNGHYGVHPPLTLSPQADPSNLDYDESESELSALWLPEQQHDWQLETSQIDHPPAIQPFKPSAEYQLPLPSPQRSRSKTPPPIQQFVPSTQPQELHRKLKSITQALLRSNAEVTAKVINAAKRLPQSNSTETDLTKTPPVSEAGRDINHSTIEQQQDESADQGAS